MIALFHTHICNYMYWLFLYQNSVNLNKLFCTEGRCLFCLSALEHFPLKAYVFVVSSKMSLIYGNRMKLKTKDVAVIVGLIQ